MFRWSTLKGSVALMLFIALAIAIEYLIVIYAVNIGVRDETCFQISWLTISPLFHLVPISTVIVLVASWTCMTKYIAAKPLEKAKPSQKKQKIPSKGLKVKINRFLHGLRSKLLRVKGFAHALDKLNPRKAIVKSALVVMLVFLTFTFMVSVIANPWLVYRSFVNLYRRNPQLLDSVKTLNSALHGFTEAVPPIGWMCSAIDNVLRSAAPGVRDFASSLGALIEPLTDLPPTGKYLVFQNLAAWTSALAVLAYGAYTRKSYRYRKAKKF